MKDTLASLHSSLEDKVKCNEGGQISELNPDRKRADADNLYVDVICTYGICAFTYLPIHTYHFHFLQECALIC